MEYGFRLSKQPLVDLGFGSKEIEAVRLRRELSVLYAQVFAGEPWFEKTRCKVCGEFSGESFGGACPVCGGKLLQAYPPNELKQYFYKEMKMPGSRLAYIKPESKLLGFAWGYQTSPILLAGGKYKTPEMQQEIEAMVQKACGESLFYFSECGVCPDERGKGIASLLSRAMVENAPAVMRTNASSPMVKIAAKLGMQQFVYYDAENPQRVMFYRV